ncbi:MAG: thioredoxin domain-containing protein [Kofleriaceae bacterium]
MPKTKLLACSLLAAMSVANAACDDTRNPKFEFKSAEAATAEAAMGSGDLASRVAALEAEAAKNKEALEFLNQVWGQQKQQREAQEATVPAPDAVFAIDVTGDPYDGPADAPVTLVKAFDFACPYCQMANDPVKQLVKEYNGKLRVVYKNFVVHPDTATNAHLAGCAAWEQKKYMQFKDAFWEKGYNAYRSTRDPSKMGEENILAIAKEVGLDLAKFTADMKGEKCKKQLEGDMAELSKFGTNATPSFYINGQPYQNGLEVASFKSVIDQKLKEVEASGVPGNQYYQKVVIEKGEKKFRSKKDPKPS